MWVLEILWKPFYNSVIPQPLSKVVRAICIESVRQMTYDWCFLDWLLSNQFQMVDIFSPNHSPQPRLQVQSLPRVGLERIWSQVTKMICALYAIAETSKMGKLAPQCKGNSLYYSQSDHSATPSYMFLGKQQPLSKPLFSLKLWL